MSDNKMLQAIIDSIGALRKDIKNVKDELSNVEKRLTKRIDRLGSDLAYLEDDAPTVEEFNNLDKRVGKLEQQVLYINDSRK